MTKYCCECPSLWLFGQLAPCLWWAAQVVPNKNWKLSLKRKIAIWREWNSLIKNPKGLLCDSSSEAAQSLYRVCRSTQCQTLQAPLDMTVCMAQGAGRLAQQPVLIAMPSLVLDSTQNCHARLLTFLINCSKQHDQTKYMLFYKTKEVQEALYLLLTSRRIQRQKPVFHFSRDIWRFDHWAPIQFTKVASSLISVGFISYHLAVCVHQSV